MGTTKTNRRRFLVAAITFSGLSAGSSFLKLGSAWAQSGGKPDPATVSMARLLLPHDAVDDAVYAEVLGQVIADTAEDGAFEEAIDSVMAALDADGDFELKGEDAQLGVLESIQDSAGFAMIFAAVRDRIYNHPEVWRVIGYEGPSWQNGGYLNRGAGEIDWLPEAE